MTVHLLPQDTLHTPMFGFRSRYRNGRISARVHLARATLSFDVADRPQLTIDVWETPDPEIAHHDWDSTVLFHFTTRSIDGPLVLDEWVRLHDDPARHLGTIQGPALDPEWTERLFVDDRLQPVWHHLVKILHASGRILPYEAVDRSDIEPDRPGHLDALLEVGALDAAALAAITS